MQQHPDECAMVARLDRALGAWGWSRTLEHCETTHRLLETEGGPRHTAFTSATVSVAVGPPHAPLVVRQGTGHAESPAQATLGQAAALAEDAALREAFLRAATATLPAGPAETAPSPAPQPPTHSSLRACLETLGLGTELAAHLASRPGDLPVSPALANQLWRTAKQLFGRRRANALWRELGLLEGQLPRGTQAQLYATHLNPHALTEATP